MHNFPPAKIVSTQSGTKPLKGFSGWTEGKELISSPASARRYHFMREALPKILIVDDESCVLFAFQRCLRNYFRIDVAPSATAALKRVWENGPYAVVLCDLRMPEVGGIELLSTMLELAPRTTRIAVTGTCERANREAAFASGRVFALLNKPCEFDEVLTCLQRGVQHHLEQEAAEAARKSSVIDSATSHPIQLEQVVEQASPFP